MTVEEHIFALVKDIVKVRGEYFNPDCIMLSYKDYSRIDRNECVGLSAVFEDRYIDIRPDEHIREGMIYITETTGPGVYMRNMRRYDDLST